MPVKKQTRGSDKLVARQRPRSARLETQHSKPAPPHTRLAPLIRRAGRDPRSLTPRDVLQLQSVLGNKATAQLLSRTAQSQPTRPARNTTGLPDKLKTGVESLSGLSLDDVRVHYNSPEPARLQALAYTRGTDIHIAPGQEGHLPHEAWHVVQQKQGRVRPTLQAKGASINDDRGLEREADLMGRKALRRAGGTERAATGAAAQTGEAVQRMEATEGLLHTSPSGPNVVQLASTNLRFDNNVTGNNRITATRHDRGPVHTQAVNWVFDHGAWHSVPDGEVCNHSRPYGEMAQAILDSIHNKTLSTAATTVKTIHTTLRDKNQGVGAPTGTHSGRMDDVINYPNHVVDVDNMIDTFNYYLYKICDYPPNLFFWPDKTGRNPDEPRGAAGNTGDWIVNNGSLSNANRLSAEKNRLSDGRDDLDAAFS